LLSKLNKHTSHEEPRPRNLEHARGASYRNQHTRNQGQGTSSTPGGQQPRRTHEEPRPRNLGTGRGASNQDQHTRNQGQGTSGQVGGPATRTNTRGTKAKEPRDRQGGQQG
jgi:hypothetical protein